MLTSSVNVSSSVKLIEVNDPRAFVALAGEWNELVAARNDQPFYRHEFIRSWIDNFAPAAKLRVMTLRNERGRLVAVLPLIEQRTALYGLPVRQLVSAGNDHSNRFDLVAEDDALAGRLIFRHLVEKKIGRDTRALYLTHYAGFPGPARAMRALADRHGLVLIEDCALSLLSADGPQPLGALGDVAVFCLYKSLPVPNGGALVVNGNRPYVFPPPTRAPVASTASHALGSLLQNLELRAGTTGAAVRRLARRLGRGTVKAAHIERVAIGSEQFRRAHVGLGMSALTMRLALSQDFDAIVARRRRNYRYLVQELGDVAPPLVESLADGVCPLFYPLVVKDKTPVMQGLAARGIETVDLWRFFHPACNPSEFPEVARLRDTVLEVPCHQDVNDRAIAHVAASVREVVLACDRPRRVVGAR